MKKFIRFIRTAIVFYLTQRRLRAQLPAIFDEIDQQLPEVIGKAAASETEKLITGAIEHATGKLATKDEIQTIIGLYSPVKAATKLIRF